MTPASRGLVTALAMALISSGCSMACRENAGDLRPAVAHWVDAPLWHAYAPVRGDFTFDALSFSVPSDGWIAGKRFLLHVVDRALTVTFTDPTGAWIDSIAFAAPSEGWASGFYQRPRLTPLPSDVDPMVRWFEGNSVATGTIWRYRHDRWEATDLSEFDWGEWTVGGVWAAPGGDAWATAVIQTGERKRLSDPIVLESVLLRWDGQRWRVDDFNATGSRRRFFNDICFQPSGEAWFVGSDLTDPHVRRPVAVHRRDHTWQPVALPELSNTHGALSEVVCLPGGRALAIGASYAGASQPRQPVLLRYDQEWHRIELPDGLENAEIGAVAALSSNDVWLAVSQHRAVGDHRVRFLHWFDGRWTEVDPPALPGGRTGWYFVKAMQFVSPDEGWAIADDVDGPGLVRGLIFHYRDGVWRNRNWNWHFWNEPGFGFCGS